MYSTTTILPGQLVVAYSPWIVYEMSTLRRPLSRLREEGESEMYQAYACVV